MAIDFQSLINERLPRLVRRESLPVGFDAGGRASRFKEILKGLMPPQEEAPDPSSQVVASETSQLEGADPEDESGFNIFNSLFSVLDAFGRPIRGVIGAGTAALKGDFDKVGSRLKDAVLSPIDSMTFNLFDVAKEKNNTTGSDILDDLGWKAGTTTEDERRIRIAMAAGLSHREAMRQFGKYGDKGLPPEIAQSFETIIQEAKKRNPELDINPVMEDFKNAVDAQDFAGFAVDVLTDPITYLSVGATGVGRAAKAVGMLAEQAPKLMKGIRAAGSKADALRLIVEAGKTGEVASKQATRLSKMVGRAWDQTKEGKPSLYLADNWAKQVREGQRAALVTLGGRPLVKGGPVAEVLSHIGQTKTAEELLGKATVSGTMGKVIELPGINKVVGGVKGLVRFARDKMDTKTGVGFVDELMVSRDAEARTHLTELGRVFNELDAEIKAPIRTVQGQLDQPRINALAADTNIVRGMVRKARRMEEAARAAEDMPTYFTMRAQRIELEQTAIGKMKELNALESTGVKVVDKISQATEQQLRKQSSLAAELMKQSGHSADDAVEAARLALGMPRALYPETSAKVAAGITAIYADVAERATAAGTRLRELNDESISYIHRMLTPEAKAHLKDIKKAQKWAEESGLEFNARSRTFNARSEDSYGKTFVELNDEYKAKHGHDLFVSDPIQPARYAVRSAQRAIANAKFAEAFVREYGQATNKEVEALFASIGDIPDAALNMRKAAELAAKVTTAKAQAAKDAGTLASHAALGKEVQDKLAKTKIPKPKDFSKIPETPDPYAVANYFKKVLKDADLAPAGEVSAFDIYNRLGLKLPDNPEDLAKLVAVSVPAEAAAFVTRALKLQAEPHRIIQYYDGITRWMKSWVTVPFLAFHGRNFLENSFKNLIEGNANPRNYKNAGKLLSQASDLNAGAPDWVGKAANKMKRLFKQMGEPDRRALRDLREAGVGDTYSKIADWLVAHNILDNRITSEFGEVAQDGVVGASPMGRTIRGMGAKVVKELGTQGGAIRGGYALGAGTENLHRVSLFLDRLDKGYSAIEAAAEVKRVFFDYRNLTNFESTYLRRGGMFYDFYRNNARYIMSKLAETPALTKQTLGLFQNDPDNPKQRWLSDKASFTAGAKEVALGFLPQQQFNMFGFDGEDITDKLMNKAQQTVGMGNPLLTTPLEFTFNKELFSGGPMMQEATTVDWSFAPEQVQDIIGYRQTPEGEHKIGRFWRLLTSAVPVVGRFSSNAILLSNKERTYWEKLAQLSSGVRVSDRDLEKEDLALIDRNLMRAKSELPLVKRDAYNNYRVNTDTAQGRVASALLFPSKSKMRDLALQPEILFTLKPYMTFDKDGEVEATDYLKAKMHEVAVNYFPKEQAFFDGVETRAFVVDNIQARKVNKFDAQAAEQFNAFLTGAR